MKQKSMIVKGDTPEANALLNAELQVGWLVHSMCPMPSSCCINPELSGAYSMDYEPQCLVILQRNDQ